MTTPYDEAFRLVIGHEGGFTNDRNDRGNWTTGKIGSGQLKGTKYGISAMSYPKLDIKNLTLEDAKEIYLKDYWNKNRCADLPNGVGYLVFDAAINHGSRNAGRFLQKAVGAGVDGIIGPQTIALAGKKNPESVINEFCVVRGLFYTDIGTFQRYKLGWFRRLFDTHNTALKQAGLLDQSNAEPEVCTCAVTDEDVETEDEEYFWRTIVQELNDLAQRAKAGPVAQPT